MEDCEMSYPKGKRKNIKTNKDYTPQGLLYWDTITYSPLSPPTELAKALAANYANNIAAQLAYIQPMNNVSVEDLAIVFAAVDQMKKNREST